MLSYEQALKNILENTGLLPEEEILIEDSPSRILQEDVYSGIEMPPFDKSAVDGYCLKASDLKAVPTKLKCRGIIQAGDIYKGRLKKGECVKIMTGAPLPQGADSVVMVEDTLQFPNSVLVLKAVKSGENVCFKAEDLKRRQKVLAKGIALSSEHVAVLATVGRHLVRVFAKPKVAVLNTGGEIVPTGQPLAGNKIYNSNGPMLQALLKLEGIQPSFLGIARDNRKDLKSAIKRGFKANVLLVSGGVSMGDYDLVPEVLADLGVSKIFHKVNIKPGKPLFLGVKNKTLVFGIPGNPVSNFLSYLIFVRPALYKMMGCPNYKPEFKEGLLEQEFYSRAGRKHFVLVKITKKEAQYFLTPVDSHGSADIVALSMADGFMVAGDGPVALKKKAKIKFITWKII